MAEKVEDLTKKIIKSLWSKMNLEKCSDKIWNRIPNITTNEVSETFNLSQHNSPELLIEVPL